MPTPVLSPKIDKKPTISEAVNENVTLLDDLGSFDSYVDSNTLAELQSITENRRRKVIKASVHPSKSTTALVELADLHALKGEFKTAIKTYKNAIKLDSYNVDAYKKLIPLLIREKSFGAAQYFYLELLDATNNHPTIRNDYVLFKLISDAAKTDDALRILQGFMKENDDFTPYKITEGMIYLVFRNDLKSASKKFLEVLKIEPDNIHANNNLGICYQHQSEFKQAQKCFEKAISIDNSYLPGYENNASNFLSQGKIHKALEALELAKEAGLTLSDLWEHNYGFFLIVTNQFERAAPWYKSKIKEEPYNNLLHNNLGVCLEHLGKPKAAKNHYLKAVDIYLSVVAANSAYSDDRAFDAFQNVCRLLQKNDEFELQEHIAKQFVDLAPNNPAGHYYLGSARIQLKKYSSAQSHLEKSLELYDDIVDPYLDLSYLQDTITHEYESAITLLKKAISKDFKNQLIFNNLAYAYIKVGKIREAKEILNKDIKLPPFAATKGLLAFYEGDFKRGNTYYRKAIESLPPLKQSEAEQVWKYERAAYWFRESNLKKALEEITNAKKISSKTATYPDILSLEKEVKVSLRQETSHKR